MVGPFKGQCLGVRYRSSDSCALSVEAASTGERPGFEPAIENQGGNADRGQDVHDVRLGHRTPELRGRTRTRGGECGDGHRLHEPRIVDG